MLAIVSNVVLPLLFAGATTLAATVLAAGWRRYGADLARLRAELAACDAGLATGRAGAAGEPRRRGEPARPGARRPARAVRAAVAVRTEPAGRRAAA